MSVAERRGGGKQIESREFKKVDRRRGEGGGKRKTIENQKMKIRKQTRGKKRRENTGRESVSEKEKKTERVRRFSGLDGWLVIR